MQGLRQTEGAGAQSTAMGSNTRVLTQKPAKIEAYLRQTEGVGAQSAAMGIMPL